MYGRARPAPERVVTDAAREPRARFQIVPRGPFSLEAAAGFGFGGTIGAPAYDGAMRLAFAVDGFAEHAGVLLRQSPDGIVEGEVVGALDVVAVRDQVTRILSLDHDGEAWMAVGERDPVIGRLQCEHPGLRPVLFHSPYEAAAWSIVSARRPALHAAEVRRRIAEQLGATFDVGGVAMSAFALPQRLLDLQPGPGLPEEKVARLRGVAEAALAGRLDPDRLRALEPDEALAQLRTLRGIGPFYAGLVLVRASGVADVAVDEPRALASAAHNYGLDEPPDGGAWAALSERWRPFRTWATVLLRVAGDRAGAPGRPEARR
jgi:DNA-3-methyladenine glycosylase II